MNPGDLIVALDEGALVRLLRELYGEKTVVEVRFDPEDGVLVEVRRP